MFKNESTHSPVIKNVFNLFKSKEEKQQEQIAAYIDQEMSQAERIRFESLVQQDSDLRAGVEAQQEIKALLSKTPKLRAPRNFVLDPAVYGGKAPAPSFIELLYPKMRLASAAVSFMFVILLGVGVFQTDFSANSPQLESQDIAQLPADAAADTQSAEAEVVPTVLPTLAVATQQEEIIVMSDEESGGEAMTEFSADDAPQDIVAADSDAAASGAAPPEPEAVEISPRVISPAEPEGERMVESDSGPAPDPAQTLVPEPTQVLMEQAKSVTDEVALVQEDFQVEAENSAAQETPAPTPLSTGPIAIWFLGLLSIALIAATMIIRRRIN